MGDGKGGPTWNLSRGSIIVGHNFIGKAQESDVSFSALSLLEPPYMTLELLN